MLHPELAKSVIHVQLVVTSRCIAQEAISCPTLGLQVHGPHPCNCTAKPWEEKGVELLGSKLSIWLESCFSYIWGQ